MPDTGSSLRPFIWRVLIVAGVAALLFILWKIATAVLLAFAGVLLAILFTRMSGALRRWSGLSHGWALGIVLTILLVLLLGGGVLLGSQIAAQFGQLSQQISQGAQQLPIDVQDLLSNAGNWLSPATRWASNAVTFLAYLLLAIFAGIYFAADPERYRRGLVLLVPPRHHHRAHEVLDTLGYALWRWLLGTLISMAIVGVLTGVGLLLLGVPAALALGLIAGILEFIPIVGPWLAGIPAVLVAIASGGFTQAIWVALLYLGIQQLESNVIYPLVQRETISLPPAVTLIAVVAFALLFGAIGVFFATPLAVALLVLVNSLYVKDALGEQPRFPK